ncbi:hypothetical protein HOF65_08380 [bacterium]|nr:hypothetical protein [bacterium]
MLYYLFLFSGTFNSSLVSFGFSSETFQGSTSILHKISVTNGYALVH